MSCRGSMELVSSPRALKSQNSLHWVEYGGHEATAWNLRSLREEVGIAVGPSQLVANIFQPLPALSPHVHCPFHYFGPMPIFSLPGHLVHRPSADIQGSSCPGSNSEEQFAQGLLWNSPRVRNGGKVHVDWDLPPLCSFCCVFGGGSELAAMVQVEKGIPKLTGSVPMLMINGAGPPCAPALAPGWRAK